MKTHTPGPWVVADDEVQLHGSTIANVTKENQWNTSAGIVTEVMPWKANAKLIAAAPELLDALSECIHTWEHHNYIVEKETGLRILSSDEMVVNAKKLIAKLTDQ